MTKALAVVTFEPGRKTSAVIKVHTPKVVTRLVDTLSLRRKDPLNITIPDDLPAAEVLRYTREAAAGLRKNEKVKTVWIAALGRLLFMARMRKDVLEAAGVESVADFERQELSGLDASRSSIWAASSIYKALPDITPQQAASLGPTKTKLIVDAHKSGDLSNSQRTKLLEKAERSTVDELREYVETKHTGQDETKGARLVIEGSKKTIGDIQECLKNPRFIAFAESNNSAKMLLAAIESTRDTWPEVDSADVGW